MATERQLRNRMKQLEEALARQQRESQQMEARILAQQQAQLKQIQQQLQEAYQRRLNETSEMYAQRVRQAQEQLVEANRRQLQTLQEEAEAVRSRLKATMGELEACNRELREELQRLRDDEEKKKTTFLSTAQEARERAQQAKDMAARTPHAYFCPQEFDIINAHIGDLQSLIESEMYQAAASDAACIELEFKLLQAKVEQAFEEWRRAFEDYRALVAALYARLVSFREQTLETCVGAFRMSPQELDFWASGTYAPLAQQITQAYETFAPMDEGQILAYLQENAGSDRNTIFNLLSSSRKLEDRLTAVINCITSERIFSDQRYAMAQAALEQLEKLNYVERENCFLPAPDGAAGNAWYIADPQEDPKNSFRLCMSIGRRNRMELRLIPVRKYGLAEGNRCTLTFSMDNGYEAITEKTLARKAEAMLNPSLREFDPKLRIEHISVSQNPDKVLAQREAESNTLPDPEAQARHLERKYQ